MKRFLIALQFLTILPVKIDSSIEDNDLGGSLLYFPLVGMFIGCLLALSAVVLGSAPILAKSAIIIIVSAVVTGGIHLDGFADTCDGFYGDNHKDRALEIMRDSQTGAMGVIGIVCLLLLKFSLITALQPGNFYKALIIMAVFSRWAQTAACFVSDYAREDGKAKSFIEHAGKREVMAGTVFTLAVFVLLSGIKGLLVFLLSCGCIFLFIRFAKKKIGGMTGDTIGAVNEIAEAAVLLFILVII